MSRLTVIPSRVLIVISTVVVALVLLLASSVQATGEFTELTEIAQLQTAEYKVQSGDSLWDIAADHTPRGRDVWTTVESIKLMNEIQGSVIRPGQVLEIPLSSAS